MRLLAKECPLEQSSNFAQLQLEKAAKIHIDMCLATGQRVAMVCSEPWPLQVVNVRGERRPSASPIVSSSEAKANALICCLFSFILSFQFRLINVFTFTVVCFL